MKKRVTIPVNNPKALVDLGKKIQAKHTADAANSVLKPLNWTTISAVIVETTTAQDKADKLKRELREAYQQRDLKLEALTDAIRSSRDILTGIYQKEMKVLGQWGFEVLDNRKAKPDVDEPEMKLAS